MKSSRIILALALSLGLVGCKPQSDDPIDNMGAKELRDLVRAQEWEISGLESDIESMQEVLDRMNQEEAPTSILSVSKTGQGKTLNSLRDKVTFATELAYPNGTETSNTMSVKITERVSFVPSNNWTLVMKGTSAELSHTSGVTGTIKAMGVTEPTKADKLEAVLTEWVKEQGQVGLNYSKVYLADRWQGMQGRGTFMIDDKEYTIYVGLVGISEQAIEYIFMYEGKESTKDEYITSLLKTIVMYSNQLKIE